MVVVELDVEVGKIRAVLRTDALDQLLRADLLFPGLEHDRGAVRVVSAHVVALIAP